MEQVKVDLKKGSAELRVTDVEDLWYLSHIIEAGDLIRGKTTRKVKIGDSENAKVVKKTLTLTVEAENIEFGSSEEELRINGKVKEGPEDIPKDSYHAISLELGSEFTLTKKTWREFQKKKLQEASEKKYSYLLCLFDREEALFGLTKPKGYQVLTRIKGEVQKKAKDDTIKKDFYEEIIKVLQEYATRYNPENIIVASPAFYKEDLFKRIGNFPWKEKIVLATCSDVEETSFDEVVKRPELSGLLKSSRLRKEKIIVEELLAEISKEGNAVYGWKDTRTAIENGAVQKLLITDKFIQEKRSKEGFKELDELMKNADASGEIFIISSQQESGKKLDGLGGIAAILRYKISY